MRIYAISYGINKICKMMGEEIVHLQEKRDLIQWQLDHFRNDDPYWYEIGVRSLTEDINECNRVIQELQVAYKGIIGNEYGIEATAEIYKDCMQDFCGQLYERGIEGVEYEDIEPSKDGDPRVKMYWTEFVKPEVKKSKKR